MESETQTVPTSSMPGTFTAGSGRTTISGQTTGSGQSAGSNQPTGQTTASIPPGA